MKQQVGYYVERIVLTGSDSILCNVTPVTTTVARGLLKFNYEKRIAGPTISPDTTATNWKIRHQGTNTTCATAPALANTADKHGCTMNAVVASGLTAGDGAYILRAANTPYVTVDARH